MTMKKMTKQLFVAAMAIAAFTACSDNNLAEVEPGLNPELTELSMNSFELTNAQGQPVTSVSGDFGTYYLNIKTDGMWYIETSDYHEFSPTRQYGRGNACVPPLEERTAVVYVSYKTD